MVYSEVQFALDKILSNVVSDFDIAYPNVRYTPSPDKAFVRPLLVTGAHIDDTLNRQGHRKQNFMYMLDVYTPLNIGTLQNKNIVDAITSSFTRGLQIDTDNTKSEVLKLEPAFQIREDDHWRFTFYIYISTIY